MRRYKSLLSGSAVMFLLGIALVLGSTGCSTPPKEAKQEASSTNAISTPVLEEVNTQPETTGLDSTQPETKQPESVKKITMKLYFARKDNSAVPYEKREIEVKDGAIMRAAIGALLQGPVNSELRKTIPDGTKLLGIKREGKVAVLDFSKEYTKVNGLSEITERASIVNTLTEIPGIEKVHIFVEGKDYIGPSGMPFGEMRRFQLDKDGYPLKGTVKPITVYFGNSNADAVVPEKREVCVTEGEKLEKIVFEELKSGPQTKGHYPVIPEGTSLISVETRDGICYLNLSKEFIDNSHVGSAGESMILNSIVNSLTELPGVKKVQFLIEGQKRKVYSHMVIDQPIARNESMIQK